ncbi:hypothetical protein ILYODFUR_035357 [Ilyodon furcidens]|uniref:Uncharacterized protein n=1 Tax=Ilyodon furcidens TaxID=33524 RepID=A0ABV0TPI4_9TELE
MFIVLLEGELPSYSQITGKGLLENMPVFSVIIFPLTRTGFLIPAAEKHPHSMMLQLCELCGWPSLSKFVVVPCAFHLMVHRGTIENVDIFDNVTVFFCTS